MRLRNQPGSVKSTVDDTKCTQSVHVQYDVLDRAVSQGIPHGEVSIRAKKMYHNINHRGQTISTTANKQHCLTALYLRYVRGKNVRKLKGHMSASDKFVCHIFVEIFM